MSKPNSNGTDLPIEVTENDPCMGSKKEEGNFFVRFRRRTCDRHGLSHKVFHVGCGLLFLTGILFVIVIALGAAWPRIPHSQQYPVCRSSQCLRAASQILESMNRSASPCSDLWTFSCGGWLSAHPKPKDVSSWNPKQQLVKQETARIRDLIATLNLPLESSSPEYKLKYLYEACLDVNAVNADEDRPLSNIISELGGWYILREWDVANFVFGTLLGQLHVKYGVHPFFKVTVEADPYTVGRNVIRISPAGLGLPRQYYFQDNSDQVQTAYKELISDVVRYLSSSPRNEAETFATNMFNYEKRIAEVTPSSGSMQNPIKTCNHLRISALKDLTINIPFYDILAAMFPDANIDEEETEVIVSSEKYLTEISQIISSTDKNTMNGYLMWTLVRDYLPYLSDKYTRVFDNFNGILYGVQSQPKRWEKCVNLAQNFLSLAVDVLDERSSPISNETTKLLNETFHAILHVVEQRIRKIRPSKQQLYHQLQRKLSSIQLQIGLPNSITASNALKEHYSKLRILKNNLFESVKHGIEFKKKTSERLLIQSTEQDAVLASLNRVTPEVVYLSSSNMVIVPNKMLKEPFFDCLYPRAVVYGRVGVEIAAAVLSAVLPYGSFWTGDRKLLSSYHLTTNDSLKTVEASKNCLDDFISETESDWLLEETALSSLKHIMAVSVANEALKASAGGQHIHQPALEEFEDDALFFLTYAQSQCSESTSQFQKFDQFVNFRLPQKSQMHLTWSQLPEFPTSFDCSLDKNSQCPLVF